MTLADTFLFKNTKGESGDGYHFPWSSIAGQYVMCVAE